MERISPLTLPRPAFFEPMPRFYEPTSVRDFPTMVEPRTFHQIEVNGEMHIIDLYATVNLMYSRYQRYQISPTKYNVISAFLQEMRFTTYVNVDRWPDVPTLGSNDETLPAERWLDRYGVRFDVIDLTMLVQDEEENVDDLLGMDIIEEGSDPDSQLIRPEEIEDEVHDFFERVMDENMNPNIPQ